MKTKRADVVASTLSLFRGRCADGGSEPRTAIWVVRSAAMPTAIIISSRRSPSPLSPTTGARPGGEICQLIAAPCWLGATAGAVDCLRIGYKLNSLAAAGKVYPHEIDIQETHTKHRKLDSQATLSHPTRD